MELKIKEVKLPEKIEFNFEELKTELQVKAKEYSAMVYTDDQIKEAKSDRAKLNSLKKALNDERIKREKEYMEPFNLFKNQINEIIKIIDEPIGIIDSQVKEYENQKKEEKNQKIREIWDSKDHPDWLSLEMIFDSKWLNSTASEKKIECDITLALTKVEKDVETLNNLPSFGFEALEVYKRNLDMAAAVTEGQRLADIQKRKAEAEEEKRRAEEAKAQEEAQAPIPEPVQEKTQENPEQKEEEIHREWIGFKALLSKEEAKALGAFIKEHNIVVKRLEVK